MIRVSVLMCCNIVDEYLSTSIDSVLRSTFKDFELVLVLNGGATIEIERLRAAYSDDERVRIFSTNIKYLNHNLNYGLQECRGEFVARMDADDVCYPQRLAQQVAFLNAHPDIGVVGSGYDLIDRSGAVIKTVNVPCKSDQIARALRYRNPICHPSVMMRSLLARDAGGYLGGIFIEDYDLWVRLNYSMSVLFANIDQPLIGYRMVATGDARGSQRAYFGMAAVQFRQFLQNLNPAWLFGALMSAFKGFIRGR